MSHILNTAIFLHRGRDGPYLLPIFIDSGANCPSGKSALCFDLFYFYIIIFVYLLLLIIIIYYYIYIIIIEVVSLGIYYSLIGIYSLKSYMIHILILVAPNL